MGAVPVGGIIMFSGKEEDLPGNWKVCRGQNVIDRDSPLFGQELPDLRRRFVRGAALQAGVGLKGGTDSVKDGVDHNHGYSDSEPVIMDMRSVSDAKTRGIFCDRPDNRTESSCLNLVSGDGFYLIGAKPDNYSIDARYKAVVIDRQRSSKNRNYSHKHDARVNFRGVTQYSRSRQIEDNRPAFVNLHYIIRIK